MRKLSGEGTLAHAWGSSFETACVFAAISLVAAILGLNNSKAGMTAQGAPARRRS